MDDPRIHALGRHTVGILIGDDDNAGTVLRGLVIDSTTTSAGVFDFSYDTSEVTVAGFQKVDTVGGFSDASWEQTASPFGAGMARDVDVLNDQANSASRAGPEARRALIQALAKAGCSYGTENGWYIDPPPFWGRDRWFLPIALRNVDYYRRLAADGGSAVERYILPLANPGAEVGFIFDGLLLSQPDRDPVAALAQGLAAVFDPTPSALEALLGMWRGVESAYLDNASVGRSERSILLSSAHYSGLLPTERQLQRPEYLVRMTPAGLQSYRRALHEAAETAGKIQPELRRRDRAEALRACVGNALADAERVSAYRGER